MARNWLVLVVLVIKAAWPQAPSYTAAGIINASDYSSGPFAPNSVVSLFGSNLAWGDGSVVVSPTAPIVLNGVAVYVDNMPAPLLYVSGPQINFVIPSVLLAGAVTVRVVKQGVSGLPVTIQLVNSAPALFDIGTGFAIATHLDGSLLSATAPGQPGEFVVVYATGLGYTEPIPQYDQIPSVAAVMMWLSDLKVSLGGAVLSSDRIAYAGVTPGYLGLYQLNIQLPPDVGANPSIQVSVGPQTNAGNLKLAVQ
jgi:uncharacterized protein (TIGR03437 family)